MLQDEKGKKKEAKAGDKSAEKPADSSKTGRPRNHSVCLPFERREKRAAWCAALFVDYENPQ